MSALALTWRAWWGKLAARERALLGAGTAVVALALLWWLALAPALAVLKTADAQHQSADAELQAMRSLASAAAQLKTQPRINEADALRTLEASVKQRLGAGSALTVLGDRANVSIKATGPDALAQWLTQVRVNARALPEQVRLTRSPGGAPSWEGTVVLVLPSKP
jgi:general secretion pathway protein M